VSVPLASARRLQARYLPDRCDVARYVETNTPDGIEQGWSTETSGLACRVDAHSTAAVERPAEGIVRAASRWVVHLPALTDVNERDRLVVTLAENGVERTFEVTEVQAKSYETVRDCLCVLVV
jgi:uncharacterized protein DUF6093